MIGSVAVFCGSKNGNDSLYASHAKEVGMQLALRKITLVYGGGNTGLMGIVADSALAHNGKVIGVIPGILKERERHHQGISELQITDDMHERKKRMYNLSDAAIILPGGNGTLDEMFEMITWNILTIHNKKIILLNSAGYYNFLIGHINNMQLNGFLYEDWRNQLLIFDTPDAIFSAMDEGKY